MATPLEPQVDPQGPTSLTPRANINFEQKIDTVAQGQRSLASILQQRPPMTSAVFLTPSLACRVLRMPTI